MFLICYLWSTQVFCSKLDICISVMCSLNCVCAMALQQILNVYRENIEILFTCKVLYKPGGGPGGRSAQGIFFIINRGNKRLKERGKQRGKRMGKHRACANVVPEHATVTMVPLETLTIRCDWEHITVTSVRYDPTPPPLFSFI